MGISLEKGELPLLSSPRPVYVGQLAELLNLPRQAIDDLISHGEINVVQIASHFYHDTEIWSPGYQHALLLCLACHFIFSSRSHVIIPLVPVMLKWHNPMSICLTETLNWLDEVHAQGITLL